MISSVLRLLLPAVCFAFLALSGCGKADVAQYVHLTPKLDLYEYFEGKTRGWGMVLDRQGTLRRQFTVDITGSIDSAGNLILDEHFLYGDGKRESRVWSISRDKESGYRGTAADVVGVAQGNSGGNALNWSYTLAIDLDGSIWNIRFNDWMFLQPDGVLLNKAVMSKFGIRVGEVIISFKKL